MKNTVNPFIPAEAVPEFTGQIIDIFEDFLELKGITIPNPERDEDPDNTAIIYGSDYGMLQDKIEDTLRNWEPAAEEADRPQK